MYSQLGKVIPYRLKSCHVLPFGCSHCFIIFENWTYGVFLCPLSLAFSFPCRLLLEFYATLALTYSSRTMTTTTSLRTSTLSSPPWSSSQWELCSSSSAWLGAAQQYAKAPVVLQRWVWIYRPQPVQVSVLNNGLSPELFWPVHLLSFQFAAILLLVFVTECVVVVLGYIYRAKVNTLTHGTKIRVLQQWSGTMNVKMKTAATVFNRRLMHCF